MISCGSVWTTLIKEQRGKTETPKKKHRKPLRHFIITPPKDETHVLHHRDKQPFQLKLHRDPGMEPLEINKQAFRCNIRAQGPMAKCLALLRTCVCVCVCNV